MADENIPPSYAVPLLPVDAILEALNDGHLMQVKKADLIPGNPEKLKEVYLVILELLHPNLSFISQQRFKDLGDISPDEMEDSVVALNVYGILRTVLGRMNFYDICVDDILMPSFKRTQAILSHLINAWRFVVSSRDEAKAPIREKFNKLYARKAMLLAEAPNIQRKVNDATTQIFELKEAANTLFQHQVTIRSEMKDELTKKETVQHINNEKKALCGNLGQEIQALTVPLAELKEHHARLEEMVVNSPEQLEEQAESCKQSIATFKMDSAKSKKRLNDAMEHARNYSMWQKRVLALLTDSMAIKEEMTFAIYEQIDIRARLRNELNSYLEESLYNHFLLSKAKHGDLNLIETKKQTLRDNILDVEATYQNLVASLKILQEKVTVLEHQHNVKKKSLNTQLKEARMSEEKLSRNVTQLDIARGGTNEEYSELISRLKITKADFKAIDKESKTYLKILNAFDVYSSILATHLKDLQQFVDRVASPRDGEAILEIQKNFTFIEIR